MNSTTCLNVFSRSWWKGTAVISLRFLGVKLHCFQYAGVQSNLLNIFNTKGEYHQAQITQAELEHCVSLLSTRVKSALFDFCTLTAIKKKKSSLVQLQCTCAAWVEPVDLNVYFTPSNVRCVIIRITKCKKGNHNFLGFTPSHSDQVAFDPITFMQSLPPSGHCSWVMSSIFLIKTLHCFFGDFPYSNVKIDYRGVLLK